MKKNGRYFSSAKQYRDICGRIPTTNCPNIDVSGSIYGMRKLFWGYERDIVRIGGYYYLQPIRR